MNPSRDLVFALTVLGAVGSGLIGGLLFAFSNFVMRALAQQVPESGIRTMQAINVQIQNPIFFGLFFGTAAVALALAIWSGMHFSRGGAGVLLIGSLLYLVGVFGVTAAINVPLNNALAAFAPDDAMAASYWPDYVRRWLQWNHLRTIASTAAAALLTCAAAWIAQGPRA